MTRVTVWSNLRNLLDGKKKKFFWGGFPGECLNMAVWILLSIKPSFKDKIFQRIYFELFKKSYKELI